MALDPGSAPFTGGRRTALAVVRLGLELAALALLGAWAYDASSASARWFAAFGVAAAVATAWTTFVAPRSRLGLADPWRLLVELVIFGLAAASLVRFMGSSAGWLFLGFAAVVALLVRLARLGV